MQLNLPKTNTTQVVIILIVIVFVLSPNISILAQDTAPSDDDVNRIASQLYCPVCENIPLDACSLDACKQWRDLIRQQLADGQTDQEIKDYFVAQYGDRVLGEPPRRGLNWLLYLVPPTAILAGLAVLFLKLFQSPETQPIHTLESKDESIDIYLEKVERDLRNLE